jgi:hypothetical protein
MKPKDSTGDDRTKLENSCIEEIKKNYPKKYEASKKSISFLRTVMAVDLIPLIQYLQCQQAATFANMQYVYDLGRLEGLLMALDAADPENMYFGRFKEIFHRLQSGLDRKGGWAEHNELRDQTLKEPLELAAKLWANGDSKNHIQMAQYLIRNFRISQDLHKILKEELKPIARKYGSYVLGDRKKK